MRCDVVIVEVDSLAMETKHMDVMEKYDFVMKLLLENRSLMNAWEQSSRRAEFLKFKEDLHTRAKGEEN
ncbi:hypothetical protein Y032_0035g3079 [Ancylostoma ceylanicum]|uniref:Uncharacterized protein n=1 Tax=Ancylostoma ceylanicum TaxID=53326 RepID=A0A016UMA2_9BILA|nr:hypothetical protein Y032_0035g3079 [Ancylostoma ceylanicum]